MVSSSINKEINQQIKEVQYESGDWESLLEFSEIYQHLIFNKTKAITYNLCLFEHVDIEV